MRGFTMLEMAVVVAIATTLTGVTLNAMSRAQNAAKFGNAADALAQDVRRARSEALARGVQTAFVVDTVGGRWWGFEAPAGVDLTTFDPTVLEPGKPGRPPMFLTGSLPRGVSFGPSAGYGVALPAPFVGVSVTGLPLNFCSFCDPASSVPGYGAIVFRPGGSVRFSAGAAGSVQQLTVTGDTEAGNRKQLVAIAGRSGAIAVFEK